MKERDWQTKLIRKIRSTGTKTFNIHGHEMQEAGWPDLFVYGRVWTGFLELKITSPERSLQRKRIRELLERGVSAYFARLDDGIINFTGPDNEEIGFIESGCSGNELLEFLAMCDDHAASVRLLWRS